MLAHVGFPVRASEIGVAVRGKVVEGQLLTQRFADLIAIRKGLCQTCPLRLEA